MTEHPNADRETETDDDGGGQVAEQGPVPATPEESTDTGPRGDDVAANPVPSPEGADEMEQESHDD